MTKRRLIEDISGRLARQGFAADPYMVEQVVSGIKSMSKREIERVYEEALYRARAEQPVDRIFEDEVGG